MDEAIFTVTLRYGAFDVHTVVGLVCPELDREAIGWSAGCFAERISGPGLDVTPNPSQWASQRPVHGSLSIRALQVDGIAKRFTHAEVDRRWSAFTTVVNNARFMIAGELEQIDSSLFVTLNPTVTQESFDRESRRTQAANRRLLRSSSGYMTR